MIARCSGCARELEQCTHRPRHCYPWPQPATHHRRNRIGMDPRRQKTEQLATCPRLAPQMGKHAKTAGLDKL